MNTSLWMCQCFLAAAFLYSGICKSVFSPRALVAMGQTGVEGLSIPLVRFIGWIEIAGVAGIILPWWLQIAPVLTACSAIGFAVIMVLALPIHYRKQEYKPVVLNAVLFCMSLFVSWGRLP